MMMMMMMMMMIIMATPQMLKKGMDHIDNNLANIDLSTDYDDPSLEPFYSRAQ